MLDIRDFGIADPTGVQDSTLALQNAINAAATATPSAGLGIDGTVFIPAGTFLITSQITIPNIGNTPPGVRLAGTGPNQSILVMNLPPQAFFTDGQITGNTLTSASFSFGSQHLYMLVNAPGLPGNAVITSINSAHSVTLSTATTGTFPALDLPVTLNIPSLVTLGNTILTIENLRLQSGSGFTAPFLLTTGTKIRASNVYFFGSGSPRYFPNAYLQSQPGAPTITNSATGGTIPAHMYSLQYTFYGGIHSPTGATFSVQPNFAANITSGTYYAVVTYMNPAGESLKSTEMSASVTGVNQMLQVTSPAPARDALWWNVYIGTATGGPYYLQNPSIIPIDQSNPSSPGVFTITTTPAASGTQPPATNSAVFESAGSPAGSTTTTGTTSTITVSASGAVPSDLTGTTGIKVYLLSGLLMTGLVGSSTGGANFLTLTTLSPTGALPPTAAVVLTAPLGFSNTDAGAEVIINGQSANTFVLAALGANWCSVTTPPSTGAASVRVISSFQDAILFGGAAPLGGGTNVGFSGYPSIVDRCVFSGVRRAAYFRAVANSTIFRDNEIAHLAGAGTNEAAIDLDGGGAGTGGANANLLVGNLIEMQWYMNGVRIANSQKNVLMNCYIGDSFSTSQYAYKLVDLSNPDLPPAGSRYNLFLGGYQDATVPDGSDGTNVVIIPNPVTAHSTYFGANSTRYGGNESNLALLVPSGVAAGPYPVTTGSTAYSYRVAARNPQGGTLASAAATMSNGSATLSAAQFNVVTIPNVNGAASYDIYGRTAGSEQFMTTVTATGGIVQWADEGVFTPSGALPLAPSGTKLVVQGWQAQSGNLEEWQNSSGAVLASVDASGNASFGSLTSTGAVVTSAAAGVSAPKGSFDTLVPYSSGTLMVGSQNSAVAGTAVQMATGTWTNTSGNVVAVQIAPTYQLGSGAGNTTDLLINRVETSLGAGATNRFLDCQVSNTTKFAISDSGTVLAPKINTTSGTNGLFLNDGSSATATAGVTMSTGTLTQSSGFYAAVKIAPTYTQSGSATATDLLVNRVENSVSGAQRLLDLQVSGVSKFNVDNKGNVTSTGNWAAAVATLTYSASITPNAFAGMFQKITVTNTTAFTINQPSNPAAGQRLTFDILNSSGGTMGAITWNAAFKLAGAFTNPASTKRRTINFYYDGSNWVETARAAADI